MFALCLNTATLYGIIVTQLESIHIEAATVITSATKLCSIANLFADLGWESLQNRRNKHKQNSTKYSRHCPKVSLRHCTTLNIGISIFLHRVSAYKMASASNFRTSLRITTSKTPATFSQAKGSAKWSVKAANMFTCNAMLTIQCFLSIVKTKLWKLLNVREYVI